MIKPKSWKCKSVHISLSSVLPQPGLYAYGHDEMCHGLEASRVYVYIGETDNLKRRMIQHKPENEQNPGLKKYLQDQEDAKCWYCVLSASSDKNRKDIEKELIQRFKPKFNIKHLTGRTSND